MFNSSVLDVAVGMIFVFLLLSLIASVVQELLSSFMQLRAANLLRGMRSLFSGDTLWGHDIVDSIYTHGLVRGLFSDPGRDKSGGKSTPPDPAQKLVAASQAGGTAAAAPQATPPAAEATATASTPAQAVAPIDPSQAHKVPGAQFLDGWRYRLRKGIGVPIVKPVNGVSNQLLLPSYIPSRTFALALIDLLNKDNATGVDAMKSIIASLEENGKDAGNKAVQAIHTLALDAANAEDKLAAFQKNIENWYNDSMDRVSGWYKRYTQRVLLAIGFIIAVSFNVSAAQVAKTLWFDKDTRQAMANAADQYVKIHPNPPAAQGGGSDPAGNPADLAKQLRGSADAFNDVTSATLLPVGWKHSGREYWAMFTANKSEGTWKALRLFFGWLITACAISLGAPFWFDMLNKIMVVRSTVKPQEKSKPEASKDKTA